MSVNVRIVGAVLDKIVDCFGLIVGRRMQDRSLPPKRSPTEAGARLKKIKKNLKKMFPGSHASETAWRELV